MSTHAIIAYREADNDHWVGVYNHSDGDTVGERLQAAVESLHQAFAPGDPMTHVRGKRGEAVVDYPYLHILELDGSVRSIPDWS